MFYNSVVVNYLGEHEIPHSLVRWIKRPLLTFVRVDEFVCFPSYQKHVEPIEGTSSALHACNSSPPLDNCRRGKRKESLVLLRGWGLVFIISVCSV